MLALPSLAFCWGLTPPPEPDATTRSAWEQAGWGEVAAPSPERDGPPPVSKSEEDTSAQESVPENSPASGEALPSDAPAEDSASQAAWEAAGWGEPTESQEEGPEEGQEEGQAEGEGAGATALSEVQAKASDDTGSSTEGFETPKTKAGDILGGSLRLTGAYLHFDDLPELFPDGDDGLSVALGRFLVRADPHRIVRLDLNAFLELARSPAVGGGAGTFASAGSTQSAYRTRFLTWEFWESGNVGGQLGLDRAAVTVHDGPFQAELGRFPMTTSVAFMFTTNDFFAPFSATAVNTIYKPGVDGVRLSSGLGKRASVELAGVLGYDPQNDMPTWGQSAVFGRAAVVGAGFEWAALGGKVAGRWVAGGSAQGDIGMVTLRSEFHVGVPDAQGDGHDEEDLPVYGRAVIGPGITFAWKNANIIAEYMFASDGARRASDYIERITNAFSDDLPYVGQHYAGLATGMEIIPILRASTTVLVNAGDGSGLVGLSVSYNVADESDLILGLFVPWGRGLRSFEPPDSIELGSEFGLSPLTAYLEARVFF